MTAQFLLRVERRDDIIANGRESHEKPTCGLKEPDAPALDFIGPPA